MKPSLVSIVRYEKPLESVRKAVNLCHGLDHLPAKARVFIKPNIVFWTRFTPFPKWGVITTSRVVEDLVHLLKERGIEDITIGEGMVTRKVKDPETHAQAVVSLGIKNLKGLININSRKKFFENIDLAPGFYLKRYAGRPEFEENFFTVSN